MNSLSEIESEIRRLIKEHKSLADINKAKWLLEREPRVSAREDVKGMPTWIQGAMR